VTGDASGRVNVGSDDVQQVLIADLSRVEAHRQHHPTTILGHVCAFICESRTLYDLGLSHSTWLSLPCIPLHRIETAPPAAILILQALDTA
jgi:hypothetical protein